MFTNQDYNHLQQAISLKSVLQEVSAHQAGLDSYQGSGPTKLALKELDPHTFQPIPGGNSQIIDIGFAPKNNQILALKDESGTVVYGQIVFPNSPEDVPYIKKLSEDEAATLKGTRHAVPVIQTANKIMPYNNSQTHPKKRLLFLEPGERLVFSIYNRLLDLGHRDQSPDTYITELIIILVLALLAVSVMWIRAIALL